MIQIGSLKTFVTDEGEKVTYFSTVKGLYYESLRKCFDSIEEDLPKFLKPEDQKNLFYTVAHHSEGKRKFDSWQAQNIIPFDLDGIDLNKIDEYAPLVAKTLGFDLEKCGVVYSGNGVHILVQVPLWKDKDFIKKAKLGYRQMLDKVVEACEDAGLPIDKDTTAWDYARILRLPFTKNVKEKDGKEVVKECRLVKNNLTEQAFTVPVLERPRDEYALAKGQWPEPDAKTIIKECDFFKWLKDSPSEVHEPHAYAMLSITGHFTDGNTTSADFWHTFNSPSINSKELGEFTEQALEASGPRTCKGIEQIWGGCRDCKHYNKVTSPIMLKSDDYIGTESMGFTLIGPKGGITRQHEDLRKFYSRETNYIHITEIKRLMVYKEGVYVKTNEDEVKAFAQKHFRPIVQKEEERKQFLYQVKAHPEAQVNTDFIHGSNNEGLINLNNGVYDLKTKTLKEHGPEYGFLYKLPYDYDPNADCPTWVQLLKNLTLDREELIDLIEEAIAFTIGNVPYTKYQHYFLLTGSGSNGKTTFINIFKSILGSSNTAAIKLSNLLSKEYYIAELEGKLANMVADEDAEAFEKKGADSTLLKALTGGDTVTARVIYEAPMQFINRAKFFYAFNNIPKIGIKSHGDIRRPIIIPFDANLDKDKSLRIDNVYEKVEGELSGILNRIIKAYDRLIENGFTKTSLSYEHLKKSRLEHDPIYDFLSTECEVSENNFTSYSQLFDKFDSDSMYQHENYKVTKRNFCKRLRQVLNSEKNYEGCHEGKSNNSKGIWGIRVKESLPF